MDDKIMKLSHLLERRTFIFGSLGLALTIPLAGCAVSNTQIASAEPAASGKTLDYVEHIDKKKIMSVDISVDPSSWQNMLDNATAEEYIEADVTINGLTAYQAGIRPKGNSSLSSIASDANSERYSFKVKFDEYVENQTWLGLDKLVLNSNWADASSMKEYLSYDILESIGVETPLFAYARITLNGELWGFYLAIEEMDKGYRRRTKNSEGEMYKPDSMGNMGGGMGGMGGGGQGFSMPDGATPPEGFDSENMTPPEGFDPENFTVPDDQNPSSEGFAPPSDSEMPDGEQWSGEMPEGMEGGMGGMGASNGVSLVYTDDKISSYSAIFDNAETDSDETDHKRVIEAIKNLNNGTDLETYVDVEACLRYFAGHTSVVSLDSYEGSMGHNYYLYENEGQISILPWDYNMSFGGFQAGASSDVVNFPIDTPVSGTTMQDRPLISKLFEVDSYLDIYHDYMQELVDGYYSNSQFERKVESIHALIASSMEEDPSAFYPYDEYLAAIEELKKLGSLRAESIQGQLDGTIPATADGQQADSSQLVDASSVDMNKLGGQDIGGRGGEMGGNRGGFSR